MCHYDCFEDDEPVISPHGGGGTAFSPIFKYMQEKDIDPVLVLYSQTYVVMTSAMNLRTVLGIQYEEQPG